MPPTFSIIIPTYNRPQQIAACVQGCADLNYPKDRFEVLVIDDGSDRPLDAIEPSAAGELRFKLIRQRNRGVAAARNTGASAATGEFLAFTDDDCIPHPDWLNRLGERLVDAPECLVGGHTINQLTNNFYSAASQVFVDVGYRFYNSDPAHGRFLTSNNFALAAAKFRALGGFDETFEHAEDREFCDRWLQAGNGILYAPEAIMYHRHWLTLRSFFKQHWNYGRGAYYFHSLRAQRKSGSMITEMKFHLYWRNWLIYPLTQVHGLDKLRMLGVIFVWQVANAGGHISERLNRGGG